MSAIKVDSEVPVAMRDGTVLRADVYRPDTSEAFPSLVVRMPYNKSNPRYQASSIPSGWQKPVMRW
jgi:predicted acyl esterase